MKYQIDDSSLDDRLAAALYQPNATYISPAIIACFITSDDWSKQSLIELKEKTDAYLLVGLQTDDQEYESLDIIEGIIRCQPDEVSDVIRLLDVNSASTIIGIDIVDVKSLFECGHAFQFIQASAIDKSESDLIKVTTYNLMNLLEKAHDTKGLFIGMESVESLPLDAFAYISEAVEKSLSNDDVSIYYSSSMTDELNSFHLKAVYAEV